MLLQAKQVHLDLRIALLAGPQSKGCCGDFIHQRNGKAVSSKVDTFDVVLARIASLDANVVIFRGVVVADLRGILFATARAQNSFERPDSKASRTNQIAPSALGGRFFDLKYADLGLAFAEGAAILTAPQISVAGFRANLRKPSSIGILATLCSMAF